MNEYDVQGYYSGGWETVFTASTIKEAREILNDYRSNEPITRFKITAGRTK
jgi:hypothetical protein